MPAATKQKQVSITDTQREMANTLLGALVSEMDPENIPDNLGKVLSPSEFEALTTNINAGMEHYGWEDGVLGVCFVGTGQAKEMAGLADAGEDAQIAITALKESGRLIQAGRGRGKALAIMNTEPLPAEEDFHITVKTTRRTTRKSTKKTTKGTRKVRGRPTKKTAPIKKQRGRSSKNQQNGIDDILGDVDAQHQRLTEAVRMQKTQVENMHKALLANQDQLAEMVKRLAEKDTEINRLKTDLATRSVTSW